MGIHAIRMPDIGEGIAEAEIAEWLVQPGETLREWGQPEALRGVGSIALGYPAADPAPRSPRKDGYIVKI